MEEYKIVIIDDNMSGGKTEPFVHTIAKLNPEASVDVFQDPEVGFQFIVENLDSKMIVFLDCKFEGYKLQGVDVLREIRKRTSLVYIIMMSANRLSTFDADHLKELINEDFISFFDRSCETDKTTEIISKVKHLWDVRFDCVLEHWIYRHPEERNRVVMKEGARNFTWNDILSEIRTQTSVGKSFEKMLNEFYIYRFPQE